MSLRKQAILGVRWTAISSLSRAILQVIQVAILARLLAPEDFGVMAVALAITLFLQIFSDAGIGNAIIHYKHINQKQLHTLYWLNICISFLLAVLIALFGHWIAIWYQNSDLETLLFIASLSLVITALGQQLRVLAEKNLMFDLLAKHEVASAVSGFSASIVSAYYYDAGVYSLIIGYLVSSSTLCLLTWRYLSFGWRPKFYFSYKKIRHFLKFGVYMVGNNVINAFNSQVDILIGAKLLSGADVGVYSVPKDLNLRISAIINPIATRVSTPVMAKMQDDVDLSRVYLQTMRMTASVNFPIYMAMALFSSEIVHLMLGDQWQDSIALLQILAFWGMFRAIGNPVGSLLVATGRADLSFKWNLVWFFIIPPSVWYGCQYGVEGMALAMLLLGVIGFWPNWYFLVRPLCHVSFTSYLIQVLVPLSITAISAIITFYTVSAIDTELLRLFLGLLFGSGIYLFLSKMFNREFIDTILEVVLKNP